MKTLTWFTIHMSSGLAILIIIPDRHTKKKRRKRVKKWIKIKKNEEQRTTKPITWGVQIDALFIGKHTLAVRI